MLIFSKLASHNVGSSKNFFGYLVYMVISLILGLHGQAYKSAGMSGNSYCCCWSDFYFIFLNHQDEGMVKVLL
jgi:hypothetical protein